MKFLLALLLLLALPTFGAVPAYTSFKGTSGILITSNPPTGDILISGAGVFTSSGTNATIAISTNGVLVMVAATNVNFVKGTNVILTATNIGSTAHIGIHSFTPIPFIEGAVSNYLLTYILPVLAVDTLTVSNLLAAPPNASVQYNSNGIVRGSAGFIYTNGQVRVADVVVAGEGVEVTAGSLILNGGTPATVTWNGLGQMRWDADGVARLNDSAALSFNRLNVGGTDAGFPAIGRTNGDLIVLGANGAFGGVATNRLHVPGGIVLTNANVTPGRVWTAVGGLGGGTWSNVTASGSAVAPPISSVQFNSNGVQQGSAGFIYTNGQVRVADVVIAGQGVEVTSGSIVMRGGPPSTLSWDNLGNLRWPSTAVMRLEDEFALNFNRLQLGGDTAAFPAIGRTNGDLIVLGANGAFGSVATNRLLVPGGVVAGNPGAMGSPQLRLNTSPADQSWDLAIDSNPETYYAGVRQGTTYAMVWELGGNVGIGTTNPTTRFDVQGRTTLRSNVFLPNISSNASPIAFLATDAAGEVFETAAPVGSGGQPASSVLSNLVGTVGNNVTNVVSLSTSNATSNPLTNSYTSGVLTLFGLEGGANVTITPNASNLVISSTGGGSVAAPISSVQFNSNGVQQGSASFVFTNGLVGIGTGFPLAALSISNDTATTPLLRIMASNNPTPVLIVNSNGNVGIGTETPVAKLSISGTQNSYLLRINTNVFVVTNGLVGIGANPVTNLHVTGTTPEVRITASTGNTGGQLAFYEQTAMAWTLDVEKASGFLNFNTYNAGSTATRVTFLDNGNVGIGTNTPAARLQVTANNSVTNANVVQFGTTNRPSLLTLDTNGTLTLPNLSSNASPIAFLATDAAGAVYETAVPTGSGFSVSGNSNQIPYLNPAGNGFIFGATNRTAPGFGFSKVANQGSGSLMIHEDETNTYSLVSIGHPNLGSSTPFFLPSLNITNRFSFSGSGDKITQEVVRVTMVDVTDGSSPESFIQTWKHATDNTNEPVTLAAGIRRDGQLNVAHGVYYPSNSLASTFPTALQLGPGGHWVGISNNSLVDIYSLNGSTTAMKILAP